MPVAIVPDASARRFVRDNTLLARPPLVPELTLHLATEVTPLWEATEAELARTGLPPPYWAFAWAGGQALARFLLDRPETVAGRRVLDFAAGGGIVALAAAQAGAAAVTAVEIDPWAVAAIELNAAANGLTVDARLGDVVGDPLDGIDVVTAGDVCYERPMAERTIAWLRPLAGAGKTVLLADPGRAYLPTHGLEALATYDVAVPLDLEDREVRRTGVYRLLDG
ncbi:MAG: methyltransferase [Alphaproteobacteria bacterium]|nr:methyltransferase [Alphaproteobacteria bacterium]